MFLTPATWPLLTDLYELTMALGYFVQGMHERRATFEVFVRRLPAGRAFLLTAGLEQAVEAALGFQISEEAIAALRRWPMFAAAPQAFWTYLRGLRFRGDLAALPEGTVAFANEPLLRVTGGLLETQMLETLLLNCLNYPTIVATKAARVVLAARGRSVFEFGARRAHGPEAAILAARSALIAGCESTSNVLAAMRFGVVPVGTMAHSWVGSFASEAESFERYAEVFPAHTTALVDTYDVADGVRHAMRLGPRLAAIRLDSGDLAADAKLARRMLDEGGCRHAKIIASGDLNECVIQNLLAGGAPIDAFGVGTELVTSRDQPALSMVYKLIEVADAAGAVRPVVKHSAGKATLGAAKTVFRRYDGGGRMCGDVIGLATEPAPAGAAGPLLSCVVRRGQRVAAVESLDDIRRRAASQLASLPEDLRRLDDSASYEVGLSEALRAAQPGAAF